MKKTFRKISGPDLMIILGWLMVGIGLGLFNLPLALIISGALLLVGGIFGSVRGDRGIPGPIGGD